MLKIRLQRTGSENIPSYRIVVAEKSEPVKGKSLEILGHYLPARDPVVFECKIERVEHWVKQGAIPSNTLARLLKRAGVKDMEKFIVRYTKRKPKGEEPAAEQAKPASETPAPPVADTEAKAA